MNSGQKVRLEASELSYERSLIFQSMHVNEWRDEKTYSWCQRANQSGKTHLEVRFVERWKGNLYGWPDWVNRCTKVQNTQESSCKYWATRWSVSSSDRSAHSFPAPHRLVHSRAPLRSFVWSLAHSLNLKLVGKWMIKCWDIRLF